MGNEEIQALQGLTYFSIIIPTYQDSERLHHLLDTLGKQSLENKLWEVLVINNDPDDFIGIEKEFPFSIQIITEPKPGSYAARNKGLELANGNIIAFTDSDCLPELQWLETAFEYFQHDSEKEIGILTGPVPLFFKDDQNLSDAELYEKHAGGFTTKQYAKDGHAITANWFSYKSVIVEFGGFNANLKSNGDSELSGKISSKYKIVYDSDLIVRHPARYYTSELVNKYKRLIGGTYTRKFTGKKTAFALHVANFILRRYRFALKKSISIPISETMAILKVCNAINAGVIQEYFQLISGEDTKR